MILKRQHIAALALLLFSLSRATGQDITVKSAFDSSRIYIGDQIKFTVTIDQPSDVVLSLPVYKDTLIKNIEILNGPAIDTSRQNNRLRIVEKYLVTSFDSGFYQVPPVYAEMKSATGLKRFYSDYVPLEVMRVKITPPDTAAKIFDIVDPYRAPVTAGEIIPWVLSAAAVIALAWLALKYFRKLKKSGKEAEPVINPDPAHVIAFRDLQKLSDDQLWQKGDIRGYYTRLTEILRQYLENRYGVLSLELTTGETLNELVRTGFKKDENYSKLKGVLTGSDLVKFAKYIPDSSEHEAMFRDSWDFVEATKEAEVVTENAGIPEMKKEGEL